MPIESVPANDRRERFVASSGQTVFPFDFPIYAAGDLAVRRLRADAETTLALGTDYSLAGAGEQAGGTVTLAAGSLAGDVLTLTSAQQAGRQAQFVNGGSLPAASLEAEFNRLEIAMQQLRDQLSRALRLAETDVSTPVLPVASARANRILAFDAQGSPIATSVAVGNAVVTPYAEGLLDDMTAAAARATLGLDGPVFGWRNLIINGNPTINQRGYVSGTPVGAAFQYTLDRWRVVVSGQALSWTDSAGVRTVTFPAGGGEQVIEGASIYGGTHTLSWIGTATATVNGSPVANGGQVTLTGGANATVRFSGGTAREMQLEPGSVATPFERRPAQVEIALCQRYYEVTRSAQFGFNSVAAVSFQTITLPYKVQKRTTPTLTFAASLSTTGVTARAAIWISTVGCGIQLTTVVGPNNFGDTGDWVVEAEL